MIQSPASRAARRRSCQARSGVVDDESLEQAEREPALLELALAEEAIGDEQPVRRALARVASRNPRLTASMSGQRTPWSAPIPGAIRRWPSR